MPKKEINEEVLNKSIDALLDDLFSTEEVVQKSKNAIDDIVGAPKQMDKKIIEDPEDDADEVIKKAPKSKKDDRPVEEVSDVPDEDQDGSRAKGFDVVQSKSSASDVANDKKTIAKSVEISKEDFEFLQKARAEKQEALQKAEKQEQEALIKAMVEEQTSELKKALSESSELVKSLAAENNALKSRPKIQKSFTSINEFNAIEKSNPVSRTFSKAETLDAAEELAKSGDLKLEEVIELENNGTIYNPASRKKIEDYLSKKGQ